MAADESYGNVSTNINGCFSIFMRIQAKITCIFYQILNIETATEKVTDPKHTAFETVIPPLNILYPTKAFTTKATILYNPNFIALFVKLISQDATNMPKAVFPGA